MPFSSVFDRHIFFHHFSPFQKIVWTTMLAIDSQNGGISENQKDSFEWAPPAKLLRNVIFEAPNAQKNENLQICAETSETAQRARECFRTIGSIP